MKKQEEPIGEDINYVQEQLLEDNHGVADDRIAILKYVYDNYPKVFWEAYKTLNG